MKRPQRPTVDRTQGELQELYRDAIDALISSCDRFDRGDTREYRQIAATTRNLCRDTRMSRSLLGQVGMKGCNFLTSSPIISPGNKLSECHLVELIIRPKVPNKPASWQAVLDSAPMEFASFDIWWTTPVVVQPDENDFSRDHLIGYVADQDGGVHVDPAIDAAFQKMRREAFNYTDGRSTTEHVDRHVVRQIAHELLKSLRPSYRRNYRLLGDYAVIRAPVFKEAGTPETVQLNGYHITPPDVLCPCGSGIIFKNCHRKGASKPLIMEPVGGTTVAPPGAAYASLSFSVE